MLLNNAIEIVGIQKSQIFNRLECNSGQKAVHAHKTEHHRH